MIQTILFSWAAFAWSGLCAPSPTSLGSDVTILINNDILANQSPNANSGVLLLSSRTRKEAAQACEALGEQLWSPELKTASIKPNLEYLTYEGKYPSTQQYWVASSSPQSLAINGQGRVGSVSSNSRLPALCTQTAPFSNWTYQDTSSKWQTTVHSNDEYITGFRDRLSFRFLGVRYAPKPERFTYSTLYEGSGQSVSALQYGSKCVQAPGNGSEDCLFLNIWTPYLPASTVTPKKDLKPVMLFVFGGGYTTGTGNDPTFDGTNLASRGDVVSVNINYRLQTFGFLVLNDTVTNGNYGFADAITALDWVIKNIEAFGGDPDRITVFGQSAGAATVRAMLASPKAIGKFVAAIAQSNLGGLKDATYSLYRTIPQELATTAQVLAETNCTNAISQLACLRAVPAYTLAGIKYEADTLVVDGTYLTSTELQVNGSGPVANVHLMMGVMRDEAGSALNYPTTTNLSAFLTSESFNGSLVASSPGLFPVPTSANLTLDVFNVSARVATDGEWRCVDQATVYAGVVNKLFKSIYFYEFNRSYALYNDDPYVCNAPLTPGIFTANENGNPDLEYFKCHAADLYFTFGTIGYNGLALRDENDLRFEQFIVDTWTSFARTYNPNPDPAFLKARGFTNTSMELEMAGTWEPMSESSLTLRELQWPSLQMELRDVPQCAALGVPIDYYLTH